MEIILGKYAGFCHGVSRAVTTALSCVDKHKMCTYGAIINNSQVTGMLEQKGIRIIDDVSEAADDETVVIRSHGAAQAVYEALNKRRAPYIDCTCPDVKKIHDIVRQNREDGRRVIIAGDESHPEIIAAKSYAGQDCIVVGAPDDIERMDLPQDGRYALVVQTTFVHENFEQIAQALRERTNDLNVYDTVCSSMINRQKEARQLSAEADIMLVIGDRNSSNTTKLFEICKQNCKKTYLIETLSDLQLNNLHVNGKIGIVAGASTPPEIIKEAFLIMSEAGNGVNQTFEEMLDESFITLHTGEVVTGTVIQVTNGEVSVNLGYKSDGLIPRNEYSDDPNVDPADHLQPGDNIEVFVVRVNDGEGNVLLSKKKIDAKRNFDEIEAAFNDKTPVTGKVTDVVKGGLIVNAKGVRVFVPSSQVSNRYVEDLTQFKDKDMCIEIIEFDKGKRRIVGGRKALAAREQEENREKVFGNIEPGMDVEGTVSRSVNFGAFVDLGGVDGLIHISELSWGRVKKVTDVLKEGDKVTVRVLDVDKSKGRISLSLKDVTNDPWSSVSERYKIGEIIEGKVVRMAAFGAFVELEEGVDGLVHISQIASRHVVKPEDELTVGQIIKVKVMDIDTENNRISLSKKETEDGTEETAPEAYEALNEEEATQEASVEAEEETYVEAEEETYVEAEAETYGEEETETSIEEEADADNADDFQQETF